jgi:hypothetical protein
MMLYRTTPTAHASTQERIMDKKQVLAELLPLWERAPYLRLGQLLHHALGSNQIDAKLVYVTDEDLIGRVGRVISVEGYDPV